jgi:hypothetical protein
LDHLKRRRRGGEEGNERRGRKRKKRRKAGVHPRSWKSITRRHRGIA